MSLGCAGQMNVTRGDPTRESFVLRAPFSLCTVPLRTPRVNKAGLAAARKPARSPRMCPDTSKCTARAPDTATTHADTTHSDSHCHSALHDMSGKPQHLNLQIRAQLGFRVREGQWESRCVGEVTHRPAESTVKSLGT